MQLREPIEQQPAALACHPVRIRQVQHGILAAPELHALVAGRKEPAAPEPGVQRLIHFAGSDEDDERRKAAIERLNNKRGFWRNLVAYVVVNGFLIGVWAITGAGYFWPVWVLAGWGIGLVLHAWNAFFVRPITEEDIEREMRHGGPSVA